MQRNQRSNCQHPLDLQKNKRFPVNIYFFTDYAKAFDCVYHKKKCEKFLKRLEYQTILPSSWEICMQVKRQQLEPELEQQAGSQLGKE